MPGLLLPKFPSWPETPCLILFPLPCAGSPSPAPQGSLAVDCLVGKVQSLLGCPAPQVLGGVFRGSQAPQLTIVFSCWLHVALDDSRQAPEPLLLLNPG